MRSIIGCAAVASTVIGLAGCGEQPQQEITLANASVLPAFARAAPLVVQDAYRFAVANPEALGTIPCYCGCGGMGHTSNLSCYVKEFRTDGTIVFDNHGFG